jgi:hypothetical protein
LKGAVDVWRYSSSWSVVCDVALLLKSFASFRRTETFDVVVLVAYSKHKAC